MTEQELAAIEARAEAATPGPWETHGYCVCHVGVADWGDAPEWLAHGTLTHPVDAEFIAHARQDVPALVAEVRRLREGEVYVERVMAMTLGVVKWWLDAGPELVETAPAQLVGSMCDLMQVVCDTNCTRPFPPDTQTDVPGDVRAD